VFAVTDEEAHHGGYSAKLVGTGAWANLQQTISVKADTNYTWSLWGKSDSDGGRLKVLTTSSAVVSECGSTIADETWQHYFCNFNSGANTSVKLYIGDGGGNHYFDDSVVH
jgi:hypothetical protein